MIQRYLKRSCLLFMLDYNGFWYKGSCLRTVLTILFLFNCCAKSFIHQFFPQNSLTNMSLDNVLFRKDHFCKDPSHNMSIFRVLCEISCTTAYGQKKLVQIYVYTRLLVFCKVVCTFLRQRIPSSIAFVFTHLRQWFLLSLLL